MPWVPSHRALRKIPAEAPFHPVRLLSSIRLLLGHSQNPQLLQELPAFSDLPCSIFAFFFFWPHQTSCAILKFWPGLKPRPAHWRAVKPLTPGPPGKSYILMLLPRTPSASGARQVVLPPTLESQTCGLSTSCRPSASHTRCLLNLVWRISFLNDCCSETTVI